MHFSTDINTVKIRNKSHDQPLMPLQASVASLGLSILFQANFCWCIMLMFFVVIQACLTPRDISFNFKNNKIVVLCEFCALVSF